MISFLTLIGVVITLVVFHQQIATSAHSAVELLIGISQQFEGVLRSAWSGSQLWLKLEPLPVPTRAFFGCLVVVLAILVAYINFGVLNDLIPEIFPFGGGAGRTLALTLAVSTCFVGLLLHQIKHRFVRVLLCLLGVALVSLIGFLAYSGAAVIYNEKILGQGGSAEEWPLDRDIVVATSLSVFCSIAELAGFWAGSHLAGSAIVRISAFFFRCPIYLGLLTTRWLIRPETNLTLQRIIDAVDSALATIAAGAATLGRVSWNSISFESRHRRSIARIDRKREIGQRGHGYNKQSLDLRYELAEAREAARFQSDKQRIENQRLLAHAKAEAQFHSELKELEHQAVRQAAARALSAVNAELIKALPGHGHDEKFPQFNDAHSSQIAQSRGAPQPLLKRIAHFVNGPNRLRSRLKNPGEAMSNRIGAIWILMIWTLMSLLTTACSLNSGRTTAAKAQQENGASLPSGVPSPSVSPAPRHRYIIVLIDASKSFQYLKQAQHQVEQTIAALGPGDTIMIARITGSFDPAVNILIERSLADLPLEFLRPPVNRRAQNEQQAALNALWRAIEAQKQEIIEASRRIESQVLRTDLHSALAYSAQRFSQAGDTQKQLFLLTDLEQDARRVKTNQPPKAEALNLQGAQVRVLFVPWSDANAWMSLARAWRDWGASHGAEAFSIHDPGQSLQMQLLTPNGAPKMAPRVSQGKIN